MNTPMQLSNMMASALRQRPQQPQGLPGADPSAMQRVMQAGSGPGVRPMMNPGGKSAMQPGVPPQGAGGPAMTPGAGMVGMRPGGNKSARMPSPGQQQPAPGGPAAY